MPADRERTLAAYIDAVAAGTAAPGGGSVSAVAGALAAALGEMVANLTVGRGPYAATEDEVRAARQSLTALRADLIAAAAADEAAYAAYRQAAALPRRTDDEKAARATAMEEALLQATDVPLGVARAAAAVASHVETVARVGNPRARSDAALGALLAAASLRGALLNVRGNAAQLRDRAPADRFLTEADRLEARGHAAAERTLRLVAEDATDGA
jgi:formiminotetrahydrofolate cyclodeaminase